MTGNTRVYGGKKLEPFIDPGQSKQISIRLGASVSYARGTTMGELTATPGVFAPYVAGNADGTQIPKGFLTYDVTTDANGVATLSPPSTGGNAGEFDANQLGVPMRISGTFKTTDLVLTGAGALDAAGLALLQGHLISGTLADGVIRIG